MLGGWQREIVLDFQNRIICQVEGVLTKRHIAFYPMYGDVGIAQGLPIETVIIVYKGCGVREIGITICEIDLPPVGDCGKWFDPDRLNFFNYFRKDRRAIREGSNGDV